MKPLLLLLPALAAISSAGLAAAAHSSTAAASAAVPTSVDATSYLSAVWSGQTGTPTWATGRYATTLASALYSVETSFALASGYSSVVDAIWSAAEKGDGGGGAPASLSASGWNWGDITTNAWYTKNVPAAVQTEVARYDSAWDDAIDSVYSEVATATGGSANAAAAPRCTGMAVAGVVAGVAAMAGAL